MQGLLGLDGIGYARESDEAPKIELLHSSLLGSSMRVAGVEVYEENGMCMQDVRR